MHHARFWSGCRRRRQRDEKNRRDGPAKHQMMKIHDDTSRYRDDNSSERSLPSVLTVAVSPDVSRRLYFWGTRHTL
jgi:hypothetical protein